MILNFLLFLIPLFLFADDCTCPDGQWWEETANSQAEFSEPEVDHGSGAADYCTADWSPREDTHNCQPPDKWSTLYKDSCEITGDNGTIYQHDVTTSSRTERFKCVAAY